MSTSPTTQAPVARKVLSGSKVGVVVSDKRDKTRTVAVQYQTVHPKYGKYIARHSKFQVHDEKNQSKNGDRVEIINCRPLSKTKNWRLVKVIQAAPAPLAEHT